MWISLLNKLGSVRSNKTSGTHRPKRNSDLRFEGLERRMLMSAVSPWPAPTPGNTISVNGHVWTADAEGLYKLDPAQTNLAAEWKGIYQQMLSGNTAGLTPVQRLEGNAEAVFENTGLIDLSPQLLERDREDAQREFDAIAGAMQLDANPAGLNIDPNTPLTEHNYLMLENTLQNDPNLYELGLQGHGLNDPPASRYDGYTNDFQNNVDNTTLFIGGGLNNNEKAIADFFDDSIMTHTPFPVVWENGKLTQAQPEWERREQPAAGRRRDGRLHVRPGTQRHGLLPDGVGGERRLRVAVPSDGETDSHRSFGKPDQWRH